MAEWASERDDNAPIHMYDLGERQSTGQGQNSCHCEDESAPPTPPIVPDCQCPRDEREIVIHEVTCLLWRNETYISQVDPVEPTEPDCTCPPDMCTCKKSGREALDKFRASYSHPFPAVLEATHPLMQKFQESLRQFLQKENERAENEIKILRDELKFGKKSYDQELEKIYRHDHDTNAQRAMILEYEETIEKERKSREEAEERARTLNERYKACKEKLNADMAADLEARQEMDALNSLVAQLEAWREDTESDMTVNQKITEKMRQEKKAKADEKRQLDVIILSLNNEIWRLESKIELYKKQMEIKAVELEKVTDRSTAYVTELEDLELDKKRLLALWNSVLGNIKQRDRVFDSVREDYVTLQENYRTVTVNLDIAKKAVQDAMEKSKELAMLRDSHILDVSNYEKQFETENQKREEWEKAIQELMDAKRMSEQDEQLLKMENQTLSNILNTSRNELEHKNQLVQRLENEILERLQDCLLNDKAVQAMAAGIRKMRDMARKMEISLMEMENSHAKVMLAIEVYRDKQARQKQHMEKIAANVARREKELEQLQEQYDHNEHTLKRKQRELGIIQKKYDALKEIYDMKSPQELRLEQLEVQIKEMRERTEGMQHVWLRLQGHVVKLTAQHQKLVAEISLTEKQIAICEQKIISTQAEIMKVKEEHWNVERSLQELLSRLQVLERTRKECIDNNDKAQRITHALAYEYSSNLKSAETELIDLEGQLEDMEKEKMCLAQELDRAQREALAWQRKGILAMELKKNIKESKSAAGEIGHMRNEIHRMEVRREQLRKAGEKLAEDLAAYVTRRENLLERTRASAAAEEARGTGGLTQQSTYKHKLRLAKSNLQRVNKELTEAKAAMKSLQEEQKALKKEIAENSEANAHLEESVASLLRECRDLERDKQYLLERVVRNQRLGGELQRAVKRRSLRGKKPNKLVIEEFKQGRTLNDRIKHIVDTLASEYPHLDDKLKTVANSLNVVTPSNSPRLTDVSYHYEGTPIGAPETLEGPYWQQEGGSCLCTQETCEQEIPRQE